jgi:hypothetical protein
MPNPVISFYGSGAQPDWEAGDFLLTKNPGKWTTRNGFVSAMIRLGERLIMRRLPKSDLPKSDLTEFCQWNHAVAVSTNSTNLHLVEAVGQGVVRSPIDRYVPAEFVYIHTDLSEPERADFVGFVESQVGVKYGYATIVSIGLSALTGTHASFLIRGQTICSGLVAAALGTYQWRPDPAFVMPSDLAAYHGLSVEKLKGLRG